jgi:hypothetical protein
LATHLTDKAKTDMNGSENENDPSLRRTIRSDADLAAGASPAKNYDPWNKEHRLEKARTGRFAHVATRYKLVGWIIVILVVIAFVLSYVVMHYKCRADHSAPPTKSGMASGGNPANLKTQMCDKVCASDSPIAQQLQQYNAVTKIGDSSTTYPTMKHQVCNSLCESNPSMPYAGLVQQHLAQYGPINKL